MKHCTACNTLKELSEFHKNKNYKDGRSYTCKPCARGRVSTWAKNNPEKVKEYSAKRAITRHGLSVDQYDQMLQKQNGACKLCKEVTSLVIDHDHNCCPGMYSCGSCIRGLLCGPCNTALGLVKENPETLIEMLKYLSPTGEIGSRHSYKME